MQPPWRKSCWCSVWECLWQIHITLGAISVSRLLQTPFSPTLRLLCRHVWSERSAMDGRGGLANIIFPFGGKLQSRVGLGCRAIKSKVPQKRLQVNLSRKTLGHPTWPSWVKVWAQSWVEWAVRQNTDTELCSENRIVSFWEEMCLSAITSVE